MTLIEERDESVKGISSLYTEQQNKKYLDVYARY